MKKGKPAAVHIAEHQTAEDECYYEMLHSYFSEGVGNPLDKLNNFSKYVPRNPLGRFLVKHELFKQIVGIHGAIIECGVFQGGGLFTWGQLSAIHEPLNHVRRVIGFDTFDGFPEDADGNEVPHHYAMKGEMRGSLNDIRKGIELYDVNRPIKHIPRIELVAGDACETIPAYVEANQHLVVALLYLDFDLYEPTRTAIEHFLPRMPKGSIIAFDELNQKNWPGETQAVQDTVGIRNLRIQRFPYQPQLSYAVLD
jgi:hypothetical protein